MLIIDQYFWNFKHRSVGYQIFKPKTKLTEGCFQYKIWY